MRLDVKFFHLTDDWSLFFRNRKDKLVEYWSKNFKKGKGKTMEMTPGIALRTLKKKLDEFASEVKSSEGVKEFNWQLSIKGFVEIDGIKCTIDFEYPEPLNK